MEVPTSSASQVPQVQGGTSTLTHTSNVTHATPNDSSGKMSSGQTSRIKKKQSDRLTVVKKRTLMIVILADLILLGALTYQMMSLNSALQVALQERIADIMGFYRFRYNEIFSDFAMVGGLYALPDNQAVACSALSGDRDAQTEMQRRLSNDVNNRGVEVAVLVDIAGTVMGLGGPRTALGTRFNPENMVTDFYRNFPRTTDQLQCTVRIAANVLADLNTPVQDVNGIPHPELKSWLNFTESAARMVLTPFHCSTDTVHGYLIMGDVMTPREYDSLNRLVALTTSSLVTVVIRTTDGSWQTQYSYNHAGQYGWQDPFPDLLPYFSADTLSDFYRSNSVQTGITQFKGVNYAYGVQPVPKQQLGSVILANMSSTEAVIIHAEPTTAVIQTVQKALLWHVPFGIVMTLLGIVTLKIAFVKFLDPMRLLIESVKKKKMREFNEHIRGMKQNRSALWAMLTKTVLVQCILLGLIIANRYLLVDAIDGFTSATIQGRIGPFVCSTSARAIMSYLGSWTGFSAMIDTFLTGNVTSDFRDDLAIGFRPLDADAIYLIGLDSSVVSSSYLPAEGRVFPEVGLMDYLRNQTSVDLSAFTTLTNWHPDYVHRFTPKSVSVAQAPAFIQLSVVPVTYVTFNATENSFVTGDMVGALVVLNVFNGLHKVCDWMADAFGTGYYGIYEWDRFHGRFAPVTTLLSTDNRMDYTYDIAAAYPDLVYQADAVFTSYTPDGIFVQDSIDIDSVSNTVSIAPYFTEDDVVLTPLMFNAYQVTAVPQERYDALLAHQMAVQMSIMAIECIASIAALLCTYWPMKTFLESLEKAFNVSSMSNDKRKKIQEKTEAILQTTQLNGAVPSSQTHSSQMWK